MNAHTQIIGDKMNVRKPQVGDRFMSILHYGEGPVYLFYGILARREEQVLSIKNNQLVLIIYDYNVLDLMVMLSRSSDYEYYDDVDDEEELLL